ncbi:MAG: hypothetical protein AAGA81_14120 [Acidobacteriota bacterium]
MSLREVLAELDVAVRGLGDVDAANKELDRYVAAASPAQSEFEKLRVKQLEATEMARRLAKKIRDLQKAEGDNSKQLAELRTAYVRATEAAREYGRAADQAKNSTQEQAEVAGKGSESLASIWGKVVGATAAAAGAIAVLRSTLEFVSSEIRELVSLGDDLDKMAQRLSVSTDALQEWLFVAERSGVEADKIEDAFKELANRVEAQPQHFRRLGVSVRDANGEFRRQEDIFADSITELAKIENTTLRVARAQQVFGETGAKLVTIIEAGPEAVEELRDRFAELGGGLSTEVIAKSAEAADGLTDFRLAMQSLRGVLAADVLPVLTRVAAGLANMIAKIAEVTRTSSTLEILKFIAGSLILTFAPLTVAVLSVVAVFAALFLVAEDLVTTLRGGDSVIGRLVERILAAVGVTATWTGVVESVGVAWDQLKLRVLEGARTMLEAVETVRTALGVEDLFLSSDIADLEAAIRDQEANVQVGLTNLAANEKQRLTARQTVGAKDLSPKTVEQNNTFQIQSTDPQAVAREVQRINRRTLREALDGEPAPAGAS